MCRVGGTHPGLERKGQRRQAKCLASRTPAMAKKTGFLMDDGHTKSDIPPQKRSTTRQRGELSIEGQTDGDGTTRIKNRIGLDGKPSSVRGSDEPSHQ